MHTLTGANDATSFVNFWAAAGSIPLYQRPQLVFQKKTLANFGAFGFASTNYEDVGFTKP